MFYDMGIECDPTAKAISIVAIILALIFFIIQCGFSILLCPTLPYTSNSLAKPFSYTEITKVILRNLGLFLLNINIGQSAKALMISIILISYCSFELHRRHYQQVHYELSVDRCANICYLIVFYISASNIVSIISSSSVPYGTMILTTPLILLICIFRAKHMRNSICIDVECDKPISKILYDMIQW